MKAGTIAKRSLQILSVLLALLFAALLALAIRYRVTRENPDDYLPRGALSYIRIDSVRKLYNDVIDLKALEIVLSTDEWSPFYKSLMDFKNNGYAKSFLFRQLLNIKADVILSDRGSPSLIIDPGYKAMFSPFLPLLINRLRSGDLSITISSLNGETVYTLSLDDKTRYNILLHKNLIFISQEKEDLSRLLDAEAKGEGAATARELERIGKNPINHSVVDLYLKTSAFLKGLPSLSELVEFPSYSYISLNLSNKAVALKGATELKAKSDLVRDFISHEPSPPGVIGFLPDTTNVYSAVNFKSFQDLYKIITSAEEKYSLEEYDRLVKFLSGMTSRDILFSWTGSEAGLFTLDTAPEPVVFIKIADDKQLDQVLNSLDKSFVLNIDDSLLIDDVRINRLKYSGITGAGLTIAGKSTDLPYFIKHKGYLFLSMNPENLAQLVEKEKFSELLVRGKTYKSITARQPQSANLYFYYDLDTAMPRFLATYPLLTRLLKEYAKGVVSLHYTDKDITVHLSAESPGSDKTSLFPGYPRNLDGPVDQLLAADVTGGDSVELIYLDVNKTMKICDLLNKELSSYTFNNWGTITLLPGKELFFNDEEGGLFLFNGKGELLNPYPRFTEARDSFPALPAGKGYFLYSSLSQSIEHYSNTGSLNGEIKVPKPVFSQPLLVGDRLYYYPKSLMGTVYCSTIRGEPVSGWPQDAGGISFSTPFLFGDDIGFLTQKGDLWLWDKDGAVKKGFPVSLPGVYYSTPAVMEGGKNLMAVISSEGVVSLVNSYGKTVLSRKLGKNSGKDLKLLAAESLLFVYGGSNYITALNGNLQIQPGFPVKGYTKPEFADINSDGQMEMISAGYDNKLYIYTLRTSQ